MQLFVALAVFEGCPATWLDDPRSVEAALAAAVEAGRFTHLKTVVQRFQPQGVTACAVVGESHLAVHTWPEEGRLFVDIASCGDAGGVRAALAALERALPSGRLRTLDERVIDPSGARPA